MLLRKVGIIIAKNAAKKSHRKGDKRRQKLKKKKLKIVAKEIKRNAFPALINSTNYDNDFVLVCCACIFVAKDKL